MAELLERYQIARVTFRSLFAPAFVVLTLSVFSSCVPATGGEQEHDRDAELALAKRLHSQASKLANALEFTEAEALYKRALAIKERIQGPNHIGLAATLNDLAVLYKNMGKYAESEALHKRSLSLREESLGPNHSRVATACSGLGVLYEVWGRYSEAEPLYRRALGIVEKNRGRDDLSVVDICNNLGVLYKNMGRYEEAEALYKRALAILRKAHGGNHPDVAVVIGNLAVLSKNQGRYGEAEALHRQQMAIQESSLGPEHPRIAKALGNLAVLCKNQGKDAEAEALHRRALAIEEKVYGPEHPDVARSLTNLAGVCERSGKYAEAEALYKRAIAIEEKVLGRQHPRLAVTIGNYGIFCKNLGRYADAEKLYQVSLAIKERAYGPGHPSVAAACHSIGRLCMAQGNHVGAAAFLQRALAIREKSLGSKHPLVATSLWSLAFLGLAQGDKAGAWEDATRAREIVLHTRRRAGASPLTRAFFLSEGNFSNLVPCLALELRKELDVLHLLEQERSLGLRELLAQARAQTSVALSPESRTRVTAALGRINSLNAEIEKRAGKRQLTKGLQSELAQAEADHQALMAELGEQYEQYVSVESARGITSAEAAHSAALDERTAIVGWVRFRDWLWGYVIRAAGIVWTELGSEGDGASERTLVKEILSKMRNYADREIVPADLNELYRRRFQRLEPHLEGIEKLLVISHGWSALLPVEILLTEEPPEGVRDCADWPWLGARYEVSYAPSVTTLDILCRKAAEEKRDEWERPLLALADPPFSEEQLARMTSDEDEGDLSEFALVADGGDDSLSRLVRYDAGAVPPRIPGTRLEAEMIAGLDGMGGALLLVGPEASERRLFEASVSEALSRCRYVHLATHGYADGERPELSCLVLARAPRDEEYDGRLDMREVFHLKLDADLVVLSACRSGLGKHLGGEGMVGLSTAFFFAGTPAVVMSLWRVSDVSTALLMRRFYENLADDRSKSSALAEAKAWLRHLRRSDLEKLRRESPELASVTRGLGAPQRVDKGELADDKPFAHPYYWAPFVLTGDPQ